MHLVVIAAYFKHLPAHHAGEELPTAVGIPYIPRNNTELALEAGFQVIIIY